MKKRKNTYSSFGGNIFSKVIKNAGVYWGTGIDNHTHTLKVGDLNISGNSSLDCLLTDHIILERINDPKLELATNSFTQDWFENKNSNPSQSKLSELLVLNGIRTI